MKKNPTWILVANRARASLFECRRGMRPPLAYLRTLEHPEGRLKDGEINADRSGRAFPRHGHGSSALEKSRDPVEHEAERFALEIASMLAEELSRDAFGDLVIVAEPRFLGRLRDALERPTRARITLTVPKDIAGLSIAELRGELDRMLLEDGRDRVTER